MAGKKRARIILVGGEKGGTGKTTIATNLAAMRASKGRDVVLIDTDPQGSASGWSHSRDEQGVSPRVASLQKFGKGLARELDDLATRYQDIIVDAGGRDSVELRAAMTKAEMIVSPVQASQFDLWTLAALDELVRTAQGFNETLVPLIVISRASTNPGTRDTADANELVADYQNLRLANTLIRDRAVYRRAASMGLGVFEYGEQNDKAIAEIQQLYDEVFGNE